MTDEKPARPNANYQLSNTNNAVNADGEEKLTFYYNRERRLAKAPQDVKDLYAEKPKRGFNLLRPLIADKPRAMLFLTIVILCAAIFLMSLLGYFNNSYSLEGNKIEIAGTKFEGITIVVIKKTVKNNNAGAYSGAVDIAVSPAVSGESEEYPAFYHRVFFTLEPVEEYRFSVPYDSADLLMVLQTEKNSLKLSFKPE